MKEFAKTIQLSLCLEFCSAMIASLKKKKPKTNSSINTSQGSYTHYSVYGEFVNTNLLFHN